MEENNGNANAGTENNGGAQGEQGNVTTFESNQTELGGVSNALSGLVSTETLAELGKLNAGAQENQPGTGAENNGGQGGEEEEEEQSAGGTENKDENNPENKPGDDKDKKDEKKPEKKNVLGIGNKKPKDTGTPIVIENPEQLLGAIKSKYGQDHKDLKDVPKFFETVDKWRADSQRVEELASTTEKYESILSGLPPEIINAMELHYSAQDYMQAFNNRPAFNFDLPVDKQDKKELVNHYFKGKFTDEDFAEETPSPALDIAITASQDKFNTEKQTRDNQRATIAANATKQVELYKASVTGSVKNLMQSFPDTDQNEVKNIQKILEGGSNAIGTLFFNNDGTLKDNAAEAIMLAVHGRSVINDMIEMSSHATETRMNEEILSRGNETRQPKKGSGAGEQQISEGAKKVLNDLNKFKQKTTF